MAQSARRKPGRPNALTPKRQKIILNALSVGVPLEHACALAGIDDSTVNMAKRKRRELVAAIKGAEGKLIQGLTSIILLAAKNGQWTAGAWLLERRWPQQFAKIERHEVSGPGGKALPAEKADWVMAVREALGFSPVRKPPQIEASVVPTENGVIDAEIVNGNGNGENGGAPKAPPPPLPTDPLPPPL
jgi:transposase